MRIAILTSGVLPVPAVQRRHRCRRGEMGQEVPHPPLREHGRDRAVPGNAHGHGAAGAVAVRLWRLRPRNGNAFSVRCII